MTTTDPNKAQQPIREAIETWAELQGLVREDIEDTIRVRLSLSENQSAVIAFLVIPTAVVFITLTDIQATNSTLGSTAIVTCAINSLLPFGSFDLDTEDGTIFFRDMVRLSDPDSVSPFALTNALSAVRFAITKYQPILHAVASGLATSETAIAKIKEKI